jgi:hypothetical protein
MRGDVYIAQFEEYAIIASQNHIYKQSGQVSIPNTGEFEITQEEFDTEYYKILNSFQWT